MAVSLLEPPKNTRPRVSWRKGRSNKKVKRWRAAVFCGLLLYFLYCSSGQLRLALTLSQELKQVEKEIAATMARSEELKREITYLKSDAYIEQVAREQLGLVKPGEIVFMAAPAPMSQQK